MKHGKQAVRQMEMVLPLPVHQDVLHELIFKFILKFIQF
jgi:hypothetical protein